MLRIVNITSIFSKKKKKKKKKTLASISVVRNYIKRADIIMNEGLDGGGGSGIL